jgi:hypothetical protein
MVPVTVRTGLFLSTWNPHNPFMQGGLSPGIRINQTNIGCLEGAQPAIASPPFHKLVATVGDLYCRTFHRSISRPVNGKYHCWRCMKEFEVRW